MGRHGSWTTIDSDVLADPTTLTDPYRPADRAPQWTSPVAYDDHPSGVLPAAFLGSLPDPSDVRMDDLIQEFLAHDPRLEDRGIDGVPATFSWWEETPAQGLALGLVHPVPTVALEWAPPAGWDVLAQSSRFEGFSWWTADLAAAAGSLVAGSPVAGGDTGVGDPYASPSRERAVPSRRSLRERERTQTSARAVLGRRLAKGGVLAATTLGVIAVSAPHGLPIGRVLTGNTASVAGLSGAALAQLTLAGPADPLEGGRLRLELEVAQEVRATAVARAQARTVAQVSSAAQDVAQQALALAVEQAQAAAVQRQAEIDHEIDQVSRDSVRDPRAYARLAVAQRGWSSSEFDCLDLLWGRESGWNYQAVNVFSGAYGIPQALPGSKMSSVAADWRTNPVTQITWGLQYIVARYGTPCGAWGHSEAYGWY